MTGDWSRFLRGASVGARHAVSLRSNVRSQRVEVDLPAGVGVGEVPVGDLLTAGEPDVAGGLDVAHQPLEQLDA